MPAPLLGQFGRFSVKKSKFQKLFFRPFFHTVPWWREWVQVSNSLTSRLRFTSGVKQVIFVYFLADFAGVTRFGTIINRCHPIFQGVIVPGPSHCGTFDFRKDRGFEMEHEFQFCVVFIFLKKL